MGVGAMAWLLIFGCGVVYGLGVVCRDRCYGYALLGFSG